MAELQLVYSPLATYRLLDERLIFGMYPGSTVKLINRNNYPEFVL